MDINFDSLLKCAQDGDSMAQYRVGLCYYSGNGVEQNSEEAVKWLKKAADAGVLNAKCNLGVCYRKGEGVLPDYIKAAKLFEEGAQQGDSVSLFNLAICYYNGNGVEQNFEKAADLYRKVAEGLNVSEISAEGVFHYDDEIVVPDASDEIKKVYRELVTQKGDLEHKLHSALKEKNDLMQSQGKLSDENEQMKKNVDELTEKLSALTKNLSETEKNIKKLTTDLENEEKKSKRLNEELTSEKKKNSEDTKKISHLNESFEQQKTRIRELEKSLAQQKEKAENEQRRAAVLKSSCTEYEEKNKKLVSALTTERKINASNKTKIDELEQTAKEKEQDIAFLRTQKPFVKKKNLLRILEWVLFAFGLIIYMHFLEVFDSVRGAEFDSDFLYYTYVLIFSSFFGLFVVEQITVGKTGDIASKARIGHFFVELMHGAFAIIPLYVAEEYLREYYCYSGTVYYCIYQLFILYAVARLLCAIISLKKEIMV